MRTTAKTVTTDKLSTLLRSKVDSDIQEYIKALAFAFAVNSKLFSMDFADKRIANSARSVRCADYTSHILEWDTGTESLADAEGQLETLLTVSEWDKKDLAVAQKIELRKKRKKESEKTDENEKTFIYCIFSLRNIMLSISFNSLTISIVYISLISPLS